MKFNLRKITTKIGFCLLILLTAVLLTRAALNYVNGMKLNRYLDNMRAEGIPLTMKELEPDCPPGDNAAREWRAAEELINFEGDDKKFMGQTLEDLFYHKPMNEEKRNRIRRLSNEHQTALRLVLEAAGQPCFKYAEEWDGPSWDLKIQNAVKEIALVNLFCLDAVVKSEEGQSEEAIERCLTLKRFLEVTLHEPVLINYLISLACVKQVAVSLQTIVSGSDADEKALERIVQAMDPLPWQAGSVSSLQGERIMALEIAYEILKGNNPEILDFPNWNGLGLWFIRPVLKNEVIYMMKTYDRLEEILSTPYYLAPHLLEGLEKRRAALPRYYKLSDLIAPNVATVSLKQAILESMFGAVQIGTACKIYHNRHGRYPATLDELTPDVISVLPLDPFTGKPFVYKLRQDGFLVYSLGSNQRDEEGRGTWQVTKVIMEKDDDWAWIEMP